METRNFSGSRLTPFGAAPRRSSPNPEGGRKHDAELDYLLALADGFEGLPDGMKTKEAVFLLERPGVAAAAGLPGNGAGPIRLLKYLLAFTRDRDWRFGSRPIVWPSVSKVADDLDCTSETIRNWQNALRRIGALVFRDSANCRRGGRRDAHGDIVLDDARGIDLSPLVFLIPKLRELDANLTELRGKRDRLSRKLSEVLGRVRVGLGQGRHSGMLGPDEEAGLRSRLPDRFRPGRKRSLDALREQVEILADLLKRAEAAEDELRRIRGERMLFDADARHPVAAVGEDSSAPPASDDTPPFSAQPATSRDADSFCPGSKGFVPPIESYKEPVGLYLRAQGAGFEERAARPSSQPEQRRQTEPPAASAPDASPAAAHTPKADGSKDGEPQASTQADRPADELPDPKDEEAARAWWKRATPFTRKWHVGQAEKNRRLDDFSWNELDDPESRLSLPAWTEFCRLERMRAEKRRAEAPVLEDAEGLTWARLTRALPRAIRSRVPEETPLPHDPSMLVQAARGSLAAVRIRPEDWDRACSIMGAPKAALCITVMAAKQETDEPIRAPGRYLAEMSRRDRLGELNLAQTLQAIVRRCERTDAGRSAFRKERPHA